MGRTQFLLSMLGSWFVYFDVPCSHQIDQFSDYSIRLCAKKEKHSKTTDKCKCERDSLTSSHKITLDYLPCCKNQSINESINQHPRFSSAEDATVFKWSIVLLNLIFFLSLCPYQNSRIQTGLHFSRHNGNNRKLHTFFKVHSYELYAEKSVEN